MKKKFLMLVTGHIVLVHKIDEKTKMVHGINLNSPNLRIKSYKSEQCIFEDIEGIPTKDEIDKGLKPVEFYNLDKDNKHHSAKVTKRRYKELAEAVLGKQATEVPAVIE